MELDMTRPVEGSVIDTDALYSVQTGRKEGSTAGNYTNRKFIFSEF